MMNIRKSLLGLLFLVTMNVAAVTPQWTDLWWNPNESGWGVNVVQQSETLFMTFFVYDQSTNPYWVYAVLTPQTPPTQNPLFTYTGTVYASKGPWFGGAFDPTKVTQGSVGSITFAPQSATQAALTYSVNGVTVAKAITREAFSHIFVGGNYQGAYAVQSSSCTGLPSNHTGTIQISVDGTLNSDGLSGAIQSTFDLENSGNCALTGEFVQSGSIYSVANVAACTTPPEFGPAYLVNYTTMNHTNQGLEGEITLSRSGCTATARFAAVATE
jgi:hypothetical protein